MTKRITKAEATAAAKVNRFTDVRMLDWIVFATFLFVLLWIIRVPSTADYLTSIGIPGDIVVLVHKAATIALGGIAGMWFDRSMFPYGRPNLVVREPDDAEPWSTGDAIAFSFACIRRAVITVGFMLSAGLAL